MNREFMELYNRELALFYEHAGEFSEEYPGVAERLGSMLQDNPDPMIGGLIEGAAFLATRVQLKLKHEFSTFTNNLLEQLVPNFLAPVPSVVLAQALPVFGDAALRGGPRMARGAYLDAAYRDRDRQIACRYRLTRDLVIWPLALVEAQYIGSVATIEAMGFGMDREALAALRLGFRVRNAPTPELEPAAETLAEKPGTWAAGLPIDTLPIHFIGAEADSVALYEQVFANTLQIVLRWRGPDGRPRHRVLPREVLDQVGFDPTDSLYPTDHRVFRGFDHLRDYFLFPQKFLGLQLRDLGRHLAGVETPNFEIVLVLRDINPRLATMVQPDSFALYCVPAINLFEKSADRILLKSGEHEYQVVPERTRYLEFEPHQVLEVSAHFADRTEKIPVYPLYSSPEDQANLADALFYTIRRVQRRRTVDETKYGLRSDYMGTDMFLTLVGAERTAERGRPVTELSLRTLCSNRHLPGALPTGETGADFYFLENDALKVRAVVPPSEPREPILHAIADRAKASFAGENAWRLINMLSLNHLGLAQNRAGEGGRALKDILALFADLSDSVIERRVRGIRNVASKPVSRRVRAMSGVAVARGLEITVTIEEKAFEGSGVFLLGAVLDRFLAEYVGLNQFTQTVIRTPERREIMRWPPRMGRRHVL